jgi:predicted secreted protein
MSIRVAFALAASLAAAVAGAESQHDSARDNEVGLQAEVSREVPNDLMTATLYAEANDPSAAQVANQLNRLTAEALKTASDFKPVKARSGAVNTYPLYDRTNKLTGWRGRAEVRLESKDFAAMANLIGKLQSSMQLAQVQFLVSPELRRQTENDLIVEGVAAFRGRAEIATKALGGKGYKIRRMDIHTAGGLPQPIPRVRAMSAASAEVAPPVFEGGTSTVQVGVNGTVEVE